ncbi:LuxR C-terminal-related transcriptional regulator, partial [Shewanella algae]|uniref:LuxR C-terminal-related transcriptional regulator n=1 Tax=Shewanella algae TaxID=38313 RepID=UPI00313E304C
DAILKVAEGDIWLPPDVAALLARMSFGPDRQAADFTARELEILRLLAKGKTMSEVAAAIGVSYKTTATTCAALRDKL